MKKLICTIMLLFFSTSVMAWGEKEQSALMGFIAGVAALEFYLDKKKERQYRPGREVIADCSNNPYKDNPRAATAWEKGCMDRVKADQYRLETEAYAEGYNSF